jgi:hypothetical protein
MHSPLRLGAGCVHAKKVTRADLQGALIVAVLLLFLVPSYGAAQEMDSTFVSPQPPTGSVSITGPGSAFLSAGFHPDLCAFSVGPTISVGEHQVMFGDTTTGGSLNLYYVKESPGVLGVLFATPVGDSTAVWFAGHPDNGLPEATINGDTITINNVTLLQEGNLGEIVVDATLGCYLMPVEEWSWGNVKKRYR